MATEMTQTEKHPIGSKIRFTKDLSEPPSGDHPGRIYAVRSGLGEITGHNKAEGYWAKWDQWPMADFGVSADEFEIMNYPE